MRRAQMRTSRQQYGNHTGFLTATDPTWALISCGKDNSYGHPHAEVMAALEDADVQVYRTDQQGTITCVSDGKELHWRTEHE